jgi:hypothetical protein
MRTAVMVPVASAKNRVACTVMLAELPSWLTPTVPIAPAALEGSAVERSQGPRVAPDAASTGDGDVTVTGHDKVPPDEETLSVVQVAPSVLVTTMTKEPMGGDEAQ